MRDALVGSVVGLAVGTVFGLFRAQPPAPGTVGGILGVVGIWAGWVAASYALGRFGGR